MPELSEEIKKFLEEIQHSGKDASLGIEGAMLHVDEVAKSVATFYEKIRGVIEWKEEHLIRKSAIERVLRRRFTSYQISPEDNEEDLSAEDFMLEMIRRGHFPNDKIPESKIEPVQKILEKYILIIQKNKNINKKEYNDLVNWCIKLASVETEYKIFPPSKEEALINFMTEIMHKRIAISQRMFNDSIQFSPLSELEKKLQIYIACQKALFNFDEYSVYFNIIKKEYPKWINPETEHLNVISENALKIKSQVKKIANHPLQPKIYKVCKKYNTLFLIIYDIISNNPSKLNEIFADISLLNTNIDKYYKIRFDKLKKRILRTSFIATLSIFITKLSSAFIIEVQIDKFTTSSLPLLPLAINVGFPPLLMFLLVSTIKMPKKENLEIIKIEISKIVYKTEEKTIYTIKIPAIKSGLMKSFILGFYIITFIITFGAIVWVLKMLNFSIISMIIFFVFLSVITFTGIRIRERSKEIVILEDKETLATTIRDIFTFPIIELGQRISKEWEKHNALVLVFNSFIDMPFNTFVVFLEAWRNFIKERKEKI